MTAFGVALDALQATLVPGDIKYCKGQPGFATVERQPKGAVTLRLRAELIYRNLGKMPIILPLLPTQKVIITRAGKNGTIELGSGSKPRVGLADRGLPLEDASVRHAA